MRLIIAVSLLTLFALGQAEGSDFGFYCSRTAILPLALCVNRADTSKSYFASEKQSNPPNHGVYNSCDEGYLHECCLDRVGYYVNHHVLPDTTLLPYRRRVPQLHEGERQEACLNPQAPRIASAKKLKVEVRRCLYDLQSDIDSSDTSSTQRKAARIPVPIVLLHPISTSCFSPSPLVRVKPGYSVVVTKHIQIREA
ncbi:hypothetical protein PSTT_05053 [Puccinia striiformis]|uniref:Hydrophobin n=1 Tax=Puccinia striiformis TaxID=27350 RepID=A0A2S4VQU8_9BASI|nr:hypothetical protein PSTT_05053 [Puccinia striiformis]